jgi:hypothetical protein
MNKLICLGWSYTGRKFGAGLDQRIFNEFLGKDGTPDETCQFDYLFSMSRFVLFGANGFGAR